MVARFTAIYLLLFLIGNVKLEVGRLALGKWCQHEWNAIGAVHLCKASLDRAASPASMMQITFQDDTHKLGQLCRCS